MTEIKTVVFKIYTDGLSWEDTPIHQTHRVFENDLDLIHQYASTISTIRETEVRWNWEGSEQGHYVGSHLKFNKR